MINTEMCKCRQQERHRHLGVVEVSEVLMVSMFIPTPPDTWMRIAGGLPDDARFMNAYFDPECRTYRFLFESPAFPSCISGRPVTHIVPITVSQLFIPNETHDES